jgi:hypothetical protein
MYCTPKEAFPGYREGKDSMMTTKAMLRCGALITCAAFSLNCHEALPVFMFPQNIIGLHVASVEQLSDRVAFPDHQTVHFVLIGENIFDEVFWDSVDFKGSMRIWWKRKPDRYRTIYLTEKNLFNRAIVHNRKMLLVPGGQFRMDAYWNLKSDDSLYLPGQMNFTNIGQRFCDYNIACSDPEEFIVEASLNVYDRLGYITAPAKSFSFVGRTCVTCGIGPVCPPPPGGCGD